MRLPRLSERSDRVQVPKRGWGLLALVAVVAGVLGAHCGHASGSNPCPPLAARAKLQTARAPADAMTVAGVEASGARFQICDQPGTYLVALEGRRELLAEEARDVLQAFNHGLAAMGVDTRSPAIVRCDCKPARPGEAAPWCMSMFVKANAVAPPAVAARLAKAMLTADAIGVSGRVEMRILSAPGPRCDAGDPACGPLPHSAQCAEQTDYAPGAPRSPVYGRGRGSCTHDGECTKGGCGNACVSTNEVDIAGACEPRGGLDHAWCGCVSGGCEWFVQGD